MLRPDTALLTTVTLSLNSASNWLPQPTGQLDWGLAMVESPASHTLNGAAAGAGAACPPGAEVQLSGAATAVPPVPAPSTIGNTSSAANAMIRFLAGVFIVSPVIRRG